MIIIIIINGYLIQERFFMNSIKISELNDVDCLFIGCVREWVKAVFYAQNPMPILKYLLSNHKIPKTMIPIDDLMRSVVLSRVKKLDFRVSNCCFLGESEKEILSVMYNYQIKKDEVATNLIDKMVDKTHRNIAISCSKLICKDFTDVGLFFNDPVNYPNLQQNINNIINYDFKNNKYV